MPGPPDSYDLASRALPGSIVERQQLRRQLSVCDFLLLAEVIEREELVGFLLHRPAGGEKTGVCQDAVARREFRCGETFPGRDRYGREVGFRPEGLRKCRLSHPDVGPSFAPERAQAMGEFQQCGGSGLHDVSPPEPTHSAKTPRANRPVSGTARGMILDAGT